MSDLFDEASEHETVERELAVLLVQRKALPEKHPDFNGQHCVDCGDEIHPVRLELGKVRCIHCQSFLERVNRG
jgi:RNA polymerase-binding transcription factor DksA